MATLKDLKPLPYYRWFWQDFRANRKVQRMTYIERGLYRELLDECWAEGGFPDDIDEMAEICGCPSDVMASAWQVLGSCFVLVEGQWHNEKMDSVRTEKDKERVIKQGAGRKGGAHKALNQKTSVALASTSQAVASVCHIEEKSREEKSRESLTPHYVRSSSDDESPDQSQAVSNVPKAERVDYQGVVDLYHKILCPPMQRCLILNKTRMGYIRQRWLDCMGELSEWEAYFNHVSKSEFLMGKTGNKGDRRPFVADLEWLCRPSNFAKVAEGKYHQ